MGSKTMDLGQVMGKSAYEAAKDAGYTGTEAAFNEALKEVPGHIGNSDIHVTSAEKTAWNGKAAATHASQHGADGGDPITPTAIRAVGYDAAQSLTSTQKEQARENIGAIGEDMRFCTDCNTAIKTGVYRINASTQNAPSYVTAGLGHLLIVMAWDVNTLVQIYFAPSHQGEYIRYSLNTSSGISWQPWECVNPRLALDVEYRTTERYLGKPVYVKVVDCGVVPSVGSYKTVGISDSLIHSVEAFSPVRGRTLPFYESNGLALAVSGSPSYVLIRNYSHEDSTTNIYATIKYTKTTD